MTTENQYSMQNPLTQYPQPKFPKQPQNPPGTVHELQPAADHGETRYKGFGRMLSRKALITAAGKQTTQQNIADITTEQFDATFKTNVYALYAPTKSAIVAFTKALVKQVFSKGIRVNAVAPGPFWTPLQPSGGNPLP